MAVPNSVLSTTLQLLRDKLVDNSFISHPLFKAIEAAGNVVKVQGGSRVEQPVIFGSHSAISEFSNGFEPMSLAVTDPFTKATFEWSNFSQPVIINKVEELANRGDLAIVNILESKMRNVMINLKRSVDQQVMVGSVSTLTTLQTLNGMGTSTLAANTAGWFEGVAPASQTNTVGGLSKTTYRSQNWFNQFYNSAGNFDLSHLDELMIQAQIYNPSGNMPSLIFLSPKAFGKFQSLIQDQVQYVSVTDQNGLTERQMVGIWRGAQIYVDPNLGFTNAAGNVVSGYVLSPENFQLYADTDGYFSVGDMIPVPGTVTMVAPVFCRVQLVTGHLASHGVLLNAES